MGWTPYFRGLGYRERAEFLHYYLQQLPESLYNYFKQQAAGLKQPKLTDPFARGYKDVLGYIVGGFCLRSEYCYISENAQAQLKKHGIDEPVYDHVYRKEGHPEYKGLTNEHTIPVSMVVEYLILLDKERLTVDYLEDFFKKVSGIALITTEENKKLNKIARNKLPNKEPLEVILNGKKPHSARYEAAGIKMAQINPNAKE